MAIHTAASSGDAIPLGAGPVGGRQRAESELGRGSAVGVPCVAKRSGHDVTLLALDGATELAIRQMGLVRSDGHQTGV